jgi:carbon-monoxide dehydrogenase large subunit
MSTTTVGRFGSGREVKRVEDAALLQGQGRFTDDVQPAGQLVIRFVRSDHARGRIVSIDTSAARAVPGVLAVYTGADLAAAGVKALPAVQGFPRPDGQPMDAPVRHPLAVGTVGFVGEAVAAVVAENGMAARDAAEALQIEIEALPAVVTLQDAIAPGAPQLWPGSPGNIAAELRHGDAAATEAAFARAAHRVQLELANQRLAPTPIEPRTSLAWMEHGRLLMRIANQMPTAVRDGIVGCLPGLTTEQVRVLVGDVGGGFGMKTGPHPEDLVVAHAARELKRPVKWVAERLEEFSAANHGRDLHTRAEMALDANGRVLAVRLRSYGNVGAYPTGAGVFIHCMLGPWVTTGIYDIQTIDFHVSAVLTNTTPIGPYRGAGRPEAVYVCERLMSEAARQLGLAPAELRRRNLIRPEQMPYRNPMGQVYDSGEFGKIIEQGLALADWNGFEARRGRSLAAGKLRGRGLATFLEWTGGGALDESASVRVSGDGYIEVSSATMAMGQGIVTSYAQLVVDVFGVPLERIRILQGDTDRANGFGSAGSRSLFTGGAAVQVTSERTVSHARDLAGEALEVRAGDLEYREGRFSVAGTDVGIGLFELAARQPDRAIVVQASASAGAASWPNGCHVAEVEVDPETGEVRLVAYSSVNDIGRVINPMIVRGQIEGGAVQGIGQALNEAVRYDAETGQLLSASFMDYDMPRADGVCEIRTAFDTSIPCRTNLLGAKGVGELGTIGATPAVVNAVIDALARAGRGAQARGLQMPLTPPVVWGALQGG